LEWDEIPILIDPDADILSSIQFLVVIDGRLTKRTPARLPVEPALYLGLGPGFHAGRDCHAVIETRRSHTLGRVYWSGATQPDSGVPEGDPRRVLRAPCDGVLITKANIGDHVEEGQVIAGILDRAALSKAKALQPDIRDSSVASLPHAVPASLREDDMKIVSPLAGVLRGMLRDGVPVTKGLKIGDVDPRNDPSACFLVSDKALAIGGGVLEAILSKEEIRKQLY
jgi:xanthine dehydrogenase accessory factor